MAAPPRRRTSATTPARVHAGAGVHQLPHKPDPLDLEALRTAALRQRAVFVRTRRRGGGSIKVAAAGGRWLGALAATTRPLRVWNLYLARRGPLMAAGCAYNMFFSIAALLVVGFSILGLVLSGNPELQDAVLQTVARAIPGLIDTGNGGLAAPEQLFSASGFSLALAISTATLLFTSLGWIRGVRQGTRAIFGLPRERINPLFSVARDLGLLALLGVALVLTTVLGLVTGAALDLVIGWLRLGDVLAAPLTRAAGLAVMLVLDMLVAIGLFRVASGITMPHRAMLQSALLAGLGATVLRYFSSLLLGSVGRNPLLAPFAVVLGLFVWFYLLSQIYMAAAAWGAVAEADARAHSAAAKGRGGLSLRRRALLLRPARTRD